MQIKSNSNTDNCSACIRNEKFFLEIWATYVGRVSAGLLGTLYSRPFTSQLPHAPPTDARSVAGRRLNVLFQVVGSQFEPHTRRLFTRKTSLLFHLSNDPTTNTDQTNAESGQKETVNVFKVKSRLVWVSNWVFTIWKSTFGNWSCVSRGAQWKLAGEGSSGISSLVGRYSVSIVG